MNRILKLDPSTASKIAAGEVVERPAMVVKELVENAIDAGATRVVVDIKKGGKEAIRVSDNGSGIHFEDINLVFERHATSKIRSIDDLYKTESLGFRGEALASICAVSVVELITMQAESAYALKIEAAGGKILKRSEVGSVKGTSILVKNLFFNTPARLKFLKNDASETKAISELMSHLALSHPEVTFKYSADDKTIFHTPGKGHLKEAIISIYEKELSRHLIEIDESLADLSIKGFVSTFDYTRGTKKDQIVFVNGRYVKSDWIKEAIQLAYKPYLMNNRFAICFLFLKVKPENIDVNIHPAKTEIKFHEEGSVKQLIYSALKKAFNLYSQVPKVSFTEKEVFKMPDSVYETPMVAETETDPVKQAKPFVSPYKAPPKVDFEALKPLLAEKVSQTDALMISEPVKNANEEVASVYDALDFIGVFDKTYLMFEKEGLLFMIDQHAAHEKILYEQFLEAFERENIMGQMLLVPEVIELSKLSFEALATRKPLLEKMGFEFDAFGAQTIALRTIPSFFDLSGAKALFLNVLEGTERAMDDRVEMQIALKACKAAVKANNVLGHLEVEKLLADLKTLKAPYTCPHGRPIIIEFSKYEIEKRFKRII